MVGDMEEPDSARNADLEAARSRIVNTAEAFSGPTGAPRFPRIARLAARLLDAPHTAIFLIDEAGGWRNAVAGSADAAIAPALIDRLIALGKPMICGDARADARLGDQAHAAPGFLACAPLVGPQDRIAGLLVITDDAPRARIDPADHQSLADLADLAQAELLADLETARRKAVPRNFDSERLALAISAASLGEFEWDVPSDIFRISPRMAKIAGLTAGEIPAEKGDRIFALIHPDDREETTRSAVEQLDTRGRFEVEYRRAPGQDGRDHWHRAAGVIVRDDQGQPSRLIGVVQDINDRKLQDAQRESLVTELDHRIKNLLAVVQSVAAQSARKSASLDVFLKTFAARLKSMSSAHDLLSAARWRGATLARIAAAELGGLAPTQTRWDGPELFLTPRAASALSLTLHELAVNAVKYGALSTEGGKVEVVWRRAPNGGFALEWLETGGPPANAPTKRGFGATLIEDVVGRELGGSARMEYRRGGLSAFIQAAPEALADGPPPEPEPAAPERIVETLVAADETVRPGAIAGLKVLIVEDSLLLALELEAGLEDAGVEVVGCAAELGEALSMLDQAFDVAVLDADLNGQSVAPVAEILRREGRPFVFATGYADKAAPMGFDAPIVRKPYNVHQIARAIADVTGRH